MTKPELYSFEQDAETLIIVIHESVGSLVGNDVLTHFKGIIEHVHQSKVKRVIVDLGEVEYFGSIFLEALLQLWNSLNTVGGKLALCHVSEVGTEILQLARFDTLWPICASRTEAAETLGH